MSQPPCSAFAELKGELKAELNSAFWAESNSTELCRQELCASASPGLAVRAHRASPAAGRGWAVTPALLELSKPGATKAAEPRARQQPERD